MFVESVSKCPERQLDREMSKDTKKYFINITVWDWLYPLPPPTMPDSKRTPSAHPRIHASQNKG